MDYTFCPLPNTSWEGVLGMFLDIFGGRRFDSTFPFAKRVSFQVSCCVFYGVHVVQKRIHMNVHYLNISRVFQIVQQKTWVAYYIYCSNYTTNFLMQKKAGFVGTNYNPILYLFQLTDLGPSYLEDTFKTLRILGPSKKRGVLQASFGSPKHFLLEIPSLLAHTIHVTSIFTCIYMNGCSLW